MEFLDNDVGAVCQVCGKRDFLPFRCKGCKKMLCLEHRSPTLHECAGLNITDATSMDCVICGKSIVHDKNRDVNEVWENHFATECTKVIAQDKKKVVCPVKSCRNILGPSNTFKCHKCSQIVCLSHRNPDYHHCIKDDKVKRKAFLDRVSNSKPTIVDRNQLIKRSKALPRKIDPENTLIGSATRRGRPEEDGLICPFCMKKGWKNVDELQTHINYTHSERPSAETAESASSSASLSSRFPPPASSSSSTSGDSGLERCPLCSATFRDPVALVTHFDTVHSGSTGRDSENNKCSTT